MDDYIKDLTVKYLVKSSLFFLAAVICLLFVIPYNIWYAIIGIVLMCGYGVYSALDFMHGVKTGRFQFVCAVCTDEQQSQQWTNVARGIIQGKKHKNYDYTFKAESSDENDKDGATINIRSGSEGRHFVVNGIYLLCFRTKTDGTMDNTNLIDYIKINEVPKIVTLENEERTEELPSRPEEKQKDTK